MIKYRFADMHESPSERKALFDDIVNRGFLEASDLREFITEIEVLIGSMPTSAMISAAKREIEREVERFCDALPRDTFDQIQAEEAYEKLTQTIVDKFETLLK